MSSLGPSLSLTISGQCFSERGSCAPESCTTNSPYREESFSACVTPETRGGDRREGRRERGREGERERWRGEWERREGEERGREGEKRESREGEEGERGI